MKKLISLVLVVVFALSFVFTVSEAEAVPAPNVLCMATCDFGVGLLWVCCPVYKGKGGTVKWECYWGAPCGTLP